MSHNPAKPKQPERIRLNPIPVPTPQTLTAWLKQENQSVLKTLHQPVVKAKNGGR